MSAWGGDVGDEHPELQHFPKMHLVWVLRGGFHLAAVVLTTRLYWQELSSGKCFAIYTNQAVPSGGRSKKRRT